MKRLVVLLAAIAVGFVCVSQESGFTFEGGEFHAGIHASWAEVYSPLSYDLIGIGLKTSKAMPLIVFETSLPLGRYGLTTSTAWLLDWNIAAYLALGIQGFPNDDPPYDSEFYTEYGVIAGWDFGRLSVHAHAGTGLPAIYNFGIGLTYELFTLGDKDEE